MEFFLCNVADLQIYCECTDTALWSVPVTLRQWFLTFIRTRTS